MREFFVCLTIMVFVLTGCQKCGEKPEPDKDGEVILGK